MSVEFVSENQFPEKEQVVRYSRRLQALRGESTTFLDHWRDLGDYLLPRRVRFDPSDRWNAGSKKNLKIINNTGTRALRILASGMMAGITSPARPWFRLRTPDPALNEKRHVKIYLEEVERRMRDVLAKSNAYNAFPLTYLDIGGYGTTSMYVEEHEDDVIRCHVPPIGSYYLAQDDHFDVNTMYRQTTLNVFQLISRFGKDKCSESVQTMFDNKNWDNWVEVVHVVEPNVRMIKGRLGPDGMPWASRWFEWGGVNADKINTFLGKGGFNEKPMMTPRWMVTGEDVYGSSPGMDALGDIRALQHMERKRATALDKIVNPPMSAPSAMRATRTSLLPGAVNYHDAQGGRQKFEPAHAVDPKVLYLEKELERHENRIGATFYADLFLMLAQSGVSNMTAREVQERHEEKMLQLGPVLERLHDELLDPFIDRLFGVMLRKGMLPEAPSELEGVDLRVEYVSILAQAQKLIMTVGVERLGSFVAQLAEMDPTALDKLDMDKMIDDYADMLGVKPDLIRAADEVATIREQRQQLAMQKESAQAAQATTQSVKNLSETDMTDDSALRRMMSSMGAGDAGEPSIGDQANAA